MLLVMGVFLLICWAFGIFRVSRGVRAHPPSGRSCPYIHNRSPVARVVQHGLTEWRHFDFAKRVP